MIQVDTPLSDSSGLQRVGRADHQVGGVSHALFYPLTRQQIVTGAASLEAMIAGDIEPLAVPRNPARYSRPADRGRCRDARFER